MFGATTIIASNYLAFARVLARSFRRHNPNCPFWVLVVDDEDGTWVTDEEDFSVLRLSQIGLAREVIHRLAGIYDVTELATAVKPALLRHLLASTGEPVLYLDPDIEVYDTLGDLASAASSHDIAVTPHLLEPLPDDGLNPDDRHILQSGVHNLGFLAIGPEALQSGFFPYWQGRTEWRAIVDVGNQLFTDQRWIDWIDCFEHVVIRDPGCNVAYWNVWSRPITETVDGWWAGGHRLRFFHYSGFDPATPWLLSRHQVSPPRVKLNEHAGLARLCRLYAESVLAAGYAEVSRTPYGWARSGRVELTRPIRRLYRHELMAAIANGLPVPPDPFDGDGDGFFRWLLSSPHERARRSGGPSVPRFVMAEYESRPDLQAAFPDPTGVSARDLTHWAAVDSDYGRRVQPTLLQALRSSLPAVNHHRPGVNIAGYLSAELGVGAAGRLVVEAARSAGLPFATSVHDATASRRNHPIPAIGAEHWCYDINILCANADSTGSIIAELGPEVVEAACATVGVWHWEAEHLPESMTDAWDQVDEVWVTSQFVRECLQSTATKPVKVMPLPVESRTWETSLRREDLGLPSGFLVLFCFDWLSVAERKNPEAVISAYEKAFRPDEGAHLVIKTINGDQRHSQLARLQASIDRPDITIRDGYVSWWEAHALIELADCYVSLHRSEGLGLTMAEAMALGKPVVATGWSGNLQFMTSDVAHLVPVELVPIPPEVPVYGGIGRWAEPDTDAAAGALRAVHDDPTAALQLGRRAREHVHRTMSSSAAAEFLVANTQRLRRTA